MSTNIQSDYRISPFLSYSVSKYLLSLAYELTVAEYGTGKINFKDGLYGSTHTAVNHGVRMVMTYYF
jgi:hypothetical protein